MNQIAEYQFLKDLCIPTMIKILLECFVPDNDDFLSRNASLNLSEGQLAVFASDILLSELQFDITNLAKNDPAANKMRNKAKYVWDSYKGLKAIVYYRIANRILDFENNSLMTKSSGFFDSSDDDEIIRDYMRLQARKISERAATETTIEINPAAQIGKGFVIDHGVGTKVAPGESKFSTVVGETCIIGENCTFLNSVLLGAAVINEAVSGEEGMARGKRHPTLGNNVTVCAGVRILGNIRVGNNVTIGPCCVIITDIPDGYNVTIVNQLQYSRPDKKCDHKTREEKPSIHGLTVCESGSLKLFGDSLSSCNLSIVTHEEGKEAKVKALRVKIIEITDKDITFNIKQDDAQELEQACRFSLRISTTAYEYILSNPQVLGDYIGKLGKGRRKSTK
ncbi:MAG: serine O-acetyltransferase [Acinetobacter sp.]